MSIRSFIIRTTFAIVAPFIGWIADHEGLSSAMMAMSVIIALVGGICLVWFFKNQKETALYH